ncbi:aldo/keto reductase [Actinophytocola gossypii]|uniref:Aldo/keto reductase n=1 Tax=Actinophytocola gossypii TaxID=2812003 RepID=A0ABT2JJ33_9PSEU|nr:aldo/keto reductase [Actinophytocola gossypii]MCT2587885.1 aldo/keto reductase [Actinophytocola gossypii]
MRTIELGRTGEQVSQLALGAMLMGTMTGEEESRRMLDHYLDAGGSFVDTANCYAWWTEPGRTGGESEELLGRWLAGRRREDVFLATKGSAWVPDTERWRDNPGAATYSGAGAATLRRELDESLRRLGTDHVDLYYVHVDDLDTPLAQTLDALAGLVAAGKIRYLGWSNVRTWRLERIRALCDRHGWPAPVALQQQYSYLRPRPGADLRSIVGDEQLHHLRHNPDLTLVAYSPLVKGAFGNPAKRAHHIMDSFRGPDADARFAAVEELAADLGATPNQVALAWLLHQTGPAAVSLVGPRTFAQLTEALPALELKLSDEQLTHLDSVSG